VPLVSWVAPANVSEGKLLFPSLAHCDRRLRWRPDVVVADMGYIDSASKQRIRERWQVPVITRLKENMKLVAPFETAERAVCPQGQTEPDPLCPCCWRSSSCPRQFSFSPGDHETLLGLIPMNTRTTQRLLQQVRPWIEPAQSYEKNQLGLSQIFFNSLRLTWSMALLADAAVLLRASVLLDRPTPTPLFELAPDQLNLDLPLETPNAPLFEKFDLRRRKRDSG